MGWLGPARPLAGQVMGRGGGRMGSIWGPLSKAVWDSFCLLSVMCWSLSVAVLFHCGGCPLGPGYPAQISQQVQKEVSTLQADYPSPLQPCAPTCLLGLAPGRGAPRPVPRGIEGSHADHVGGVAG